jgi:DNA-binding PadR family transcriptional regulator
MSGWRHHHRRHRHLHGWNFGPWAWEGRFFERGEVSLALLSLLQSGPKHGYELMKDLEARSGNTYRASPGTIYPKLQQLQDQGLVTSTSQDGGKRVYQLTDEGRETIEREADTIEKIWNRAEHEEWSEWESPYSADVLRPAFRLMKAAFRSVHSSGGERKHIERVQAILDAARAEIDRLGYTS